MLHRGRVHSLEKGHLSQLVDEQLDRFSLHELINDINDSGLLRFEFVSVLAESSLLFKTNGRQTPEVKEFNKLNDTVPQHHMLFFITSASSC